MKDFHDVLAFHQKFNLPQGWIPNLLPPDQFEYRRNFLQEEVEEYKQAWLDGNLVAAVDALLDFVYVACGTALFIGCPRIGEVGRWPNYSDSAVAAMSYGLTGINQPPRLLPTGLHNLSYQALKNRVHAFELAHRAALIDEDCGTPIYAAIHMLKQCCLSAYSTAALMYVPWDRCWRHVQDANMAKKRAAPDGSDSKRESLWDVIKPAGWRAPDSMILIELELAGWKIPETVSVNHVTGKIEVMKGEGE